MNVTSLAQSPLFMSGLVVCCLVGGYAFALFVRGFLTGFSDTVASSGAPKDELLTIDLTGKFQEQLDTLLDRVDRVKRLSRYFPDPFQDSSWERLLRTCDALQSAQRRTLLLIKDRDFIDALELSRFLAGKTFSLPQLKEPLDQDHIPLLTEWHKKTTQALQRMIAKVEDAELNERAKKRLILPRHFFDSLASVRQSIIEDEDRYT
jgi:hypothetical protein